MQTLLHNRSMRPQSSPIPIALRRQRLYNSCAIYAPFHDRHGPFNLT